MKPKPPSPDDEVLYQIPVHLIDIGDQNVRHGLDDEDIVELAGDIARRGLLQPIGVRAAINGRYQLRFGSRRLAAHVRLRRATILARIHEGPDDQIKAVAIVENLLRKQMSLEEEIDAVTHLHLVDELSPDQVATACGKSRAWVLRRLAVRSFPPAIGRALTEGSIALGAAEILAQIADEGMREWLLGETIRSKLGVTQVRDATEALKATPSIEEAVAAGVAVATSTAPPPAVYVECAACARPRKLAELTLIRVCADGCITTTSDEKGGDHGPH